MTDPILVQKKITFIETCLADLKRDANIDTVTQSTKERRFVEHTLQIMIQAIIDIAAHIVSDERLGEPSTNKELFQILNRNGILSSDVLPELTAMAGFRNILVHGYTEVDTTILKDIVENRTGDIDKFIKEINKYLEIG